MGNEGIGELGNWGQLQHFLSLNCFYRSQMNIRKLKTDRNDPVGFVYFENTSFIFKAMRWRSSSVKLDPDGKHKPSSNNFSDTVVP